MRLLSPENNTLGWWRLGSETEMFGRFARGFADPSSSLSVFPLVLDRGLWGGLPLTTLSMKSLAIRVLFFDQGTGIFKIKYDALSSTDKTLLKVQKTGSGSWKEVCATIEDGRFAGNGPQGADIWLLNGDSENDIFGGLEIADASIDDISLKGCEGQLGVVVI